MWIIYSCIPENAIFFRMPGHLDGVGYFKKPVPKPGALSCNDCIWMVPGTVDPMED